MSGGQQTQRNIQLDVTQQTQRNIQLDVTQQTQCNIQLDVTQQTQRNAQLDVTQQTQCNIQLDVTQQTQRNIQLDVTQQTQCNIQLDVTQQTQRNIQLDVTHSQYLYVHFFYPPPYQHVNVGFLDGNGLLYPQNIHFSKKIEHLTFRYKPSDIFIGDIVTGLLKDIYKHQNIRSIA